MLWFVDYPHSQDHAADAMATQLRRQPMRKKILAASKMLAAPELHLAAS